MSAPLFGKVAGAEVSDAQVRFANVAARAVVDTVVDRIGLKVAAAAADLSPSHLRQAIDQREGRNLDLNHHLSIMRFATDGERAEWLDAIGYLFGRKSTPLAPRTDAERLAALEEKVQRRFGSAGAEIVDDERSRP